MLSPMCAWGGIGRRRHLRQAIVLAGASTIAALVPVTQPAVSDAAGLVAQIGQIDAGGLIGHIGIDLDGGQPVGYDLVAYWSANGNIDDVAIPGSPAWVRFELYPASHAYDPWTLDVGGAHLQRDPSMGESWLTLGDITLPRAGVAFGDAVGFRIEGAIVSTSSVPDGRVQIDSFQLGPAEPDPFIPPLPHNDAGVEFGAFATSTSRGNRWTAGVGWPGRYVLFIRDTATGRYIQAIADLAPGSVPTIDLDAVCFGFYTCQYDRGAPADAAGAFHPLAPTRVLDTRARLGIRNGPVRTGGGWSPSPNRIVRHDEVVNHELKVTGRFGVPSTGVSAVLLNVVAVDAPAPGYIAVRPRRPSCCSELAIHDDRSALDPNPPPTSNLNVGAVDAVANLVLARVGAGGTINLYNSLGPTQVVADIAGWFDSGTPDPHALGYVSAGPSRVLDTRDGTGGPVGPVSVGETRTITVAGVAGVPPDAASVLVNVTATRADAAGYVRAFPTGISLPEASTLNFTAGADRASVAVVRVGPDGRIMLRVDDAPTHLVVDVLGAFVPGGARVTAIAPVRVADSRSGLGVPAARLGDGDLVGARLGGTSAVPAGTIAVVLNVTVTEADGAGFVTVFPDGSAEPATSNVNYTFGTDVPNVVIASLGADGSVVLRNHGARAHVVVDLLGYMTG
jgi:hypothetical protein